MPYGNGKGPEGNGYRTGRGLGYCSGSSSPGYMNENVPRRGAGIGNNRGNRGRNIDGFLPGGEFFPGRRGGRGMHYRRRKY